MRKAVALMRSRGLTVGAFAGWADAGRSASFTPRAVTVHHTGAAVDVDRILRDGRADLPGPLCNWALHRDGSWWLVASGRANHAGVGWLPSSESYGIEATGPVPVTAQGVKAFPNYEQYVLGVACILEAEGWSPGVVYAHKETATPDGRKIDPAFGDPFPKPYRDMDRFRGQVQAAMNGEDDMTADELLNVLRSAEGQKVLRRAIWGGKGEEIPSVAGTLNAAQTVEVAANGVRVVQNTLSENVIPALERIEDALSGPEPPSS
jgi:hypothetical protein